MIVAVDPEKVRRIADDILRRPEFRPNPTDAWMERIFQLIGSWFSRLSSWSQSNPGWSEILVVLLSIVLIALLAHVAYTVIREFLWMNKETAAPRTSGSRAALEGVAEDWGGAIEAARRALNAGDLYRAIWIMHRTLLSVLDQMRMLEFARWKTNSDYLRECRASGSALSALVEVTTAYNNVIYAHAGFDREQAAHFLERVEILMREAR